MVMASHRGRGQTAAAFRLSPAAPSGCSALTLTTLQKIDTGTGPQQIGGRTAAPASCDASHGALVLARGARQGVILLAGRCIGRHQSATKPGPKAGRASASRADGSGRV